MQRRYIKPHIVDAAKALHREHGDYRTAGEAIGFSFAALNHIANGNAEDVSAATVREFARLVGAKVRRTPVRWVVSDEQDARAKATGRSRREIIETGLSVLEGR